MTGRKLTLSLTLLVLIAACQQEVALEPAPEALVRRAETCPQSEGWTKVDSNSQGAEGDWGTVTPVSDGIEVDVNEGFTVEFCVKGGEGYASYDSWQRGGSASTYAGESK